MPLFAFCVARAVYYTHKKGTITKYIQRLLAFSVISQIPYICIMRTVEQNIWSLNIGFTWLFSVIFLLSIISIRNHDYTNLNKYVCFGIIAIMLILPFFLDINYGLSGILYPAVFYFLIYNKEGQKEFIKLPYGNILLGIVILSILFIIQTKGNGISQIFAIFSVPILIISNKYDNRIKLPKKFFYAFYPVHLIILWLIKLYFCK